MCFDLYVKIWIEWMLSVYRVTDVRWYDIWICRSGCKYKNEEFKQRRIGASVCRNEFENFGTKWHILGLSPYGEGIAGNDLGQGNNFSGRGLSEEELGHKQGASNDISPPPFGEMHVMSPGTSIVCGKSVLRWWHGARYFARYSC